MDCLTRSPDICDFGVAGCRFGVLLFQHSACLVAWLSRRAGGVPRTLEFVLSGAEAVRFGGGVQPAGHFVTVAGQVPLALGLHL
jgi:hypothetical protein